MTREHLPALYRAIGKPEVFAGGYGGGPEGLPPNLEAFITWAERYYAWESGNSFVIVVNGGENDGLVIGTTTLSDFNLANESSHLGWTAYSPAVWGTGVNPEAKLLVLGFAFEHGFGRVKLQADARNERSRAAILKLGAKFEGVLRRHKARADGTFRDSAMYSVLIDEWPEVRAGLQKRIAAAGPLVLDRAIV